jgi:hypothetical protein
VACSPTAYFNGTVGGEHDMPWYFNLALALLIIVGALWVAFKCRGLPEERGVKNQLSTDRLLMGRFRIAERIRQKRLRKLAQIEPL